MESARKPSTLNCRASGRSSISYSRWKPMAFCSIPLVAFESGNRKVDRHNAHNDAIESPASLSHLLPCSASAQISDRGRGWPSDASLRATTKAEHYQETRSDTDDESSRPQLATGNLLCDLSPTAGGTRKQCSRCYGTDRVGTAGSAPRPKIRHQRLGFSIPLERVCCSQDEGGGLRELHQRGVQSVAESSVKASRG